MYNRSSKPTNAEESHSATIRHIHRAHHRDQSSAPKFQVRCRLATVRETSTATKHHVYLCCLRHGRRCRTTCQRWKSRRSGRQSRTVCEVLTLSAPPPPLLSLSLSRRRSRRWIWVWLFDFVVDADTYCVRKKFALTVSSVRNALRPDGKCPDTPRPEGRCLGMRHPDDICVDTLCPEAKCHDTPHP